jgi:hypothetical protein
MKRTSIIAWLFIILVMIGAFPAAGTQEMSSPTPLFRITRYEMEVEVAPAQ